MNGSPDVEAAILVCLRRHLTPLTAAQVLAQARRSAGLDGQRITQSEARRLLLELSSLLANHIGAGAVALALGDLGRLGALTSTTTEPPAGRPLEVAREADVVTARSSALETAQRAGFVYADAIKVATVVSELARNILQYAGSGSIDVQRVEGLRRGIKVEASDSGPGITNVEEILSGRYRSKTGMGLGLVGSRRLVDALEIRSTPGRGTVVIALKYLAR